MDIRKFWRLFRRRMWIPASLAAAGVLIGAVLALLAPPEYNATATVIAKGSANVTDKTLNFEEVVMSNTVAMQVRDQLALYHEGDSLEGRVKVSNDRSNLYRISVSDPNPGRAVRIANAVAGQAAVVYTEIVAGADLTQKLQTDQASYREQLATATRDLFNFQAVHPNAEGSSDQNVRSQFLVYQFNQKAAEQAYLEFQSQEIRARIDSASNAHNVGAQVVDQATVKSDTSSRLLEVGYAAGVGLLLGLGLIFVLEYLDNSVRKPDEVEQMLGLPVIAVIPHGEARSREQKLDMRNA